MSTIRCGIRQNANGIRDLTATCEVRFAKSWKWMQDWERKTDGIRDSDERISGGGILVNNGAGIRDQDPSFQTLKHEQETLTPPCRTEATTVLNSFILVLK